MSTSGGFTPPSTPPCAYAPRMTRAAALALRTAGTLNENCVVVITDGPTIGTAGNTSVTEITLQPTAPNELSELAEVNTTFDNVSWKGVYDIDANSITELTDSSGNTAKDTDATAPTVHTQFPWHLGTTLGGSFRDNTVEDATLAGWNTQVGSVINNTIQDASVSLTGKTAGTISGNYIGPGVSLILPGITTIQDSQFRTSDGTSQLMAQNTAGGTLTIRNCVSDAEFAILNNSTGSVIIDDSKLRNHHFGVFDIHNASTGILNILECDFTTVQGLTQMILHAATTTLTISGTKILSSSVRTVAGAAGTFTIIDSELVNESGVSTTLLNQTATNTGAIGITAMKSVGTAFSFNGAAVAIIACEYVQCSITIGGGSYSVARSKFDLHTYSNAGTGVLAQFNDCIVIGSNVTRAASSTGTMTIASSRFTNGANITTNAGAATVTITDCAIDAYTTTTADAPVTYTRATFGLGTGSYSGAGSVVVSDSDWKFSNLTTVALSTATFQTISGCTIRDTNLNIGAGATAGFLSFIACNIQGGSGVATISQNSTGALNLQGFRMFAGTMTHNGTGAIIVTDSEMAFTTTTIAAGSGAPLSIASGSSLQNVVISITATATAGSFGIISSQIYGGSVATTIAKSSPNGIYNFQGAIINQCQFNMSGVGAGNLAFIDSRAEASNINMNNQRQLTIQNSDIINSTITQSRSLNVAQDQILNSEITNSTVTITGAGGAAALLVTINAAQIKNGSVVTITDPTGNNSLQQCTIDLGAIVNIPSGGFNVSCRYTGGTVNTGAFTHTNTVIDLAGTTTLTAANVNRLRNKAFSDVI